MAKRVSLKDIADKLGISTALVSYVLNGQEKEKRVGAEVVLRIKKAVEEMNYIPNQIARSLRKGTTNTIGLIVADIANPFFGTMARIVENEANRCGYTVVIGSSDEDCKKSSMLINNFLNRQVDGLIIVPSEGCENQVKSLIKRGIPLVLFDRYTPDLSSNHVVLDNYLASFDAISHLIQQGYKRIGMIAYRSGLIHMKERVRGYVEAMKDHKLEKYILIKEVKHENVKIETEQALQEITHGEKKIDAIFFATNTLSISGLYGIQKMGLKVPDELGVIGFDGAEAFDFFYSPLSYIRQPIDEMVKESVKILFDQIKGSIKITHVKLAPQLIKRQSCG